MKLHKSHWLGFIASFIILAVAFFVYFGDQIFPFLAGIAVVVLVMPFFFGLLLESRVEREKSERFLEFTRNLAESVKTGTPIGKSILNISSKDFGSLSPYIQKLANQIGLGIPISRALDTFASDVNNTVVSRAITLIREAENAGGEIDRILDSTASSIYEIEKLKRERKSAISNLVVQGYIIFFVFIGIMLVMQFKILPLTAGVGSLPSVGSLQSSGSMPSTLTGPSSSGFSVEELSRPFLYLLLVQGFCTGLTIGKISEGTIRSGLRHSIVLTLVAFLVSTGANAL